MINCNYVYKVIINMEISSQYREWIVAGTDPGQAYEKVKEYLNYHNIGLARCRELISVTVIGKSPIDYEEEEEEVPEGIFIVRKDNIV